MCEENGPSLSMVSFVIIMYTAERITLVILCRVNNCVGEGNLKFFLLFLLYAGNFCFIVCQITRLSLA